MNAQPTVASIAYFSENGQMTPVITIRTLERITAPTLLGWRLIVGRLKNAKKNIKQTFNQSR